MRDNVFIYHFSASHFTPLMTVNEIYDDLMYCHNMRRNKLKMLSTKI